MTDSLHFHAELKNWTDFFVSSGFNPLDERARELAVFDLIEIRSEAEVKRPAPRVTLYLPPEQISAETEAQFRRAMQRLIDERQFVLRSERMTQRSIGAAQVPIAIILGLALLIGANRLADQLGPLVYAMAYLVGIVLVWVVASIPIELMYYTNLHPRRTYQALTNMKTLDLTFMPAPIPETVDGEKL